MPDKYPFWVQSLRATVLSEKPRSLRSRRISSPKFDMALPPRSHPWESNLHASREREVSPLSDEGGGQKCRKERRGRFAKLTTGAGCFCIVNRQPREEKP